jgi:hypothetical protein
MKTEKVPTNTRMDTEYLRQLAFTINRAIDDSNVYAHRVATQAGDIVAGDGIVLADTDGTGFTLTLPTAASAFGKMITVIKMNAGHTLTIAAQSGETINGSASVNDSVIYRGWKFFSTGEEWLILP